MTACTHAPWRAHAVHAAASTARLAVVLALGLATADAAAQSGPDGGPAPQLLVSGYNSDTVHRFDAADGTPLGDLGPLPGAQSVRYGPDGALYAVSEKTDRVLRFDGATGALLGEFVADDPGTPDDETGGLGTPTSGVFGPDGHLYVGSFGGDRVLRYDGQTGAYLGVFVTSGSGNLNGPDAGMDFGPDGHLYVPSFNNNRVLRFDGETGASLGTFAAPMAGTLSRPRALRWRGDGLLYVTSWGNNRILRYDLDGDLVDIFATTPTPTGLAFGPDGHVWVANDQNNAVRRHDGETGVLLDIFIPGGTVDGATWLEFLPDPELRLSRPTPAVAGGVSALGVRNGDPGAPVLIGVSAGVASTAIGCPGAVTGLQAPVVLPFQLDASGELSLSAPIPLALAGVSVTLQAFAPASCRLSNLVLVTFG